MPSPDNLLLLRVIHASNINYTVNNMPNRFRHHLQYAPTEIFKAPERKLEKLKIPAQQRAPRRLDLVP